MGVLRLDDWTSPPVKVTFTDGRVFSKPVESHHRVISGIFTVVWSLTMSKVRLSDLPVLRVALEYLDPRSLGRLGLTNKECHTLSEIVADYVLRHLGYIVTHGYISNEGQDQSYANLLHRLTAKRIILIGGGSMEEGEASYKRADHLDIASGEWKSCSSMTKKRGTFKTEAVAVGNFAVAVSGDDESAVGTLEAYSPLSDTWIDLPTLPEQLMLVAAAAINQTLYISGGINKTTGQYSNVVRFLLRLSLSLSLSLSFCIPWSCGLIFPSHPFVSFCSFIDILFRNVFPCF